jgi:propanediol dehydratase small subunit
VSWAVAAVDAQANAAAKTALKIKRMDDYPLAPVAPRFPL